MEGIAKWGSLSLLGLLASAVRQLPEAVLSPLPHLRSFGTTRPLRSRSRGHCTPSVGSCGRGRGPSGSELACLGGQGG